MLARPRRALGALVVVLSVALALCLWRAESSPPAGVDESGVLAERGRHLDALGVTRWHRAGFRGAGIKIAVLDTGFRGYREQLGSKLPVTVTAHSFRRDGNLEARDSNHGVLCAEVIHAFAPDAELLFANWEPDHPETFVAAARWCREQGARIVSCSVIMPAWGDGEGGGAVHRKLTEIFGEGRKPGDVLAIACAGNLAPRHWGGAFTDDGHGHHRWNQERIDNGVTPWGGERVSLELTCSPEASFAVEVTDDGEAQTVGERLEYHGTDRHVSIVRFAPQAGHSYRLRVRHVDGPASPFHVVALAAWLECAQARGSIPFPGDGAEWLTVAAVDADGRRMPYSSCGPNSRAPKPDLSAPVPFPTLCRSLPFSGTSAAAPQGAGTAALIWSRHPDWRVADVRREMVRVCQDLGPAGHDVETGFGRLTLPIRP